MQTKISNDELFRIAKDAYRVRNYHLARKFFRKLVGRSPSSFDYKLWLAKTLAHYEDKVDEAEYILFKLRRTSFFNPATIELGHIEATQGNYNLARSYFEELSNSIFSGHRATFEIGKLNERFRNFDDAKKNFTSLLTSEDINISLLELIYIEIQEGNYESAYSYYIQLMSSKNAGNKCAYKKIADFLKYKLGILAKFSLLEPSYFLKQLSDYSQVDTINSMKANFAPDDYSLAEGSFLKGTDVSEIFHLATGAITNTSPTFFDTTSKTIVRVSSPIGVSNSDLTNALLISTIPGTSDIVNIKPVITGEKAKTYQL